MADIKPYTIYGIPGSTCTRAVAVALQELKVPYNIIEVNMRAQEHKSSEYLEPKQPFGQIPVLVRPSDIRSERHTAKTAFYGNEPAG